MGTCLFSLCFCHGLDSLFSNNIRVIAQQNDQNPQLNNFLSVLFCNIASGIDYVYLLYVCIYSQCQRAVEMVLLNKFGWGRCGANCTFIPDLHHSGCYFLLSRLNPDCDIIMYWYIDNGHATVHYPLQVTVSGSGDLKLTS